VVSLPPALLDALVEHDEKQDEERHHAGELWQEGGWIFTQPNGKPLDPRADHQEWKALLEAAGVREARLHDARHTAATMLLVLKVPPRVVMEIMGWSEISMTSRYQHVPDHLRQGIANQVNGLLWNSDDGNGSAGTW
jgi:integrase